MLSNFLIHEWLGEGWLIKFIVSKSSVSDNIDNHILMELLSVFCCNLTYSSNIFNAVPINVEDGCSNTLTNICTIETWSALDWVCSETNLIVSNYMDGTSSCIIEKFSHLDRFVNNTLTWEGSITMNKNRYDLSSVDILHKMLFTSYSA